MGEGGDNLPLNRNSVRIDFTIKRLAHCNGVVMPAGRRKVPFRRVEPELQAIEEMEAGPIEERSGLGVIFGSEEDGGAEEPFEAFHEAAVVGAVRGKMEKVEHFGGRIEMKLTGFLPQGECGHPDGDEAVLAEAQSEVGMGNDVQKEFAVAPTMDEFCGGRATKREPAQYEGPGIEGKFLASIGTLFADETDGFDLPESLFGDAKVWQDLR
jgi:hypothetical protein